MYCLGLSLCYKSEADQKQQGPHDPGSLKCFLSGPFQKIFVDRLLDHFLLSLILKNWVDK